MRFNLPGVLFKLCLQILQPSLEDGVNLMKPLHGFVGLGASGHDPPDQVSSYVIVTDSDGDHTIDLLDVVSVDPGSDDKSFQN